MNGYDWRRMAAAADYDRRARMHAPLDPETLAAAIRKLRSDGLRPRDIAVTLRLELAAVVEALRYLPTTGGDK